MTQKIRVSETTFEFGVVQIIDNIVIAIMKEGIVFDISFNTQLISFCKEKLGTNSFGYISLRKNSYAVDPTVYLQTAQIPNLRAIAIVSDTHENKQHISIEKQFCNQPFEVFDNLAQATNWMHNILPS